MISKKARILKHSNLIVLSLSFGFLVSASGSEVYAVQQLRRPVAIGISQDEQLLFVANRDSGSVTVIDTNTETVAGEITIGGRLSDLGVVDAKHLVVTDTENHRLLLVEQKPRGFQVAAQVDIAPHPARVVVDSKQQCCYVASLWSRTISRIDFENVANGQARKMKVSVVQQLAFEPLELCLVTNGSQLIVAGAFNSMLAAIDTESLLPVATKTILGHNIRGIAIAPGGDTLLIAHQHLNELARSTRDDIHWGNMISNQLTEVSLVDMLAKKSARFARPVTHFLGEPGNGAGDPGSIAVSVDDVTAVAVAGVGEVALRNKKGSFWRIGVGKHPVAVCAASTGAFYVANMFSDSVSVIHGEADKPPTTISLGSQPQLTAAQRGELHFFDSKLSHDGWMSCHSCHSDGHTNGLRNDNLSDGSFAAPKRVLSLHGVGHTGPWAWNGQFVTLDEQVASSVKNTMQSSVDETQVKEIVAFLKTLPTIPKLRNQRDKTAIEMGRALFDSLDCRRCHTPPTFTSNQTYDVGLVDELGNRMFNPPSLLGVSRRTALLHDASVKSLHDLFSDHRHQLNRKLKVHELDSLVAFLQSL